MEIFCSSCIKRWNLKFLFFWWFLASYRGSPAVSESTDSSVWTAPYNTMWMISFVISFLSFFFLLHLILYYSYPVVPGMFSRWGTQLRSTLASRYQHRVNYVRSTWAEAECVPPLRSTKATRLSYAYKLFQTSHTVQPGFMGYVHSV